ncbi:hypothetical protein FHL15_001399 [Xylaria flabelliformis]|uniref:Uncharacterized protein n=1 Tax=Xylaria flabelliformis TaxID=2512241 RepID=A0A553IBR7_9PEZI|nr:hypothetical protein FHL15_001399 [Xylaria flabelliformis]
MDSLPKPSPGLRKGYKRVRFKRDSILEEVRIIERREPRRRDHHRQKHTCSQECSQSLARSRERDKALNLYEVPPLFRCKSYEEICDVIEAGKGAIADVFQGYTVLQWYCNAKSTSPGIIQELLHHGVDINALDQRTHNRRRPVIRHTALGYACRNANVKAVHSLLQNGADPRGLTGSAASLGMPKQDVYGNLIVYPSPLQELLCQRIHGPRPGQCPGTYHLTEEDEDNDDYLDEDDPERMPVFRAFAGLSDTLSEYGPISARERRRSCYYDQIQRLGNRIRKCVQLLLNYGCSCPPVAFPEGDDPHLWPGIDYLLETFWHFFHPLTICESRAVLPEEPYLPMSPEHLSQISRPIFSVFGEICDMLLESAGYEAKGTVGTTRGQDRLIRLIAEHPEFSSFKHGEYFDVDTELEKELLKSSSTSL